MKRGINASRVSGKNEKVAVKRSDGFMRLHKDGSGPVPINLGEEIRRLKGNGTSLRKIAATLHLSHEAVRKRLKNLEGRNQVSTEKMNQELTRPAVGNEKVSTGSKVRKSRVREQVRDTVNQVSTIKTPCRTPNETVNPLESPSDSLTEGRGGVFQEGDLVAAIMEVFKSKGIEVYRMKVEPEAYQVSYNGQVLRIYVSRKIGPHGGQRTVDARFKRED